MGSGIGEGFKEIISPGSTSKNAPAAPQVAPIPELDTSSAADAELEVLRRRPGAIGFEERSKKATKGLLNKTETRGGLLRG